MQLFSELKYNEQDLIPAIIQNHETFKVLMMGYMNSRSLQKTLQTGKVVFYSRSRQELWTKGETSGNYLFWKEIKVDCDGDCLLISVDPKGPTCHTGEESCFFRRMEEGEIRHISQNSEYIIDPPDHDLKNFKKPGMNFNDNLDSVIAHVYNTVMDRKNFKKEGSYTNYLLEKGIDKILKKLGEECAETIIAAKNNSKTEIVYEVSDLMYHLVVMLVDRGVSPLDIYDELISRMKP